MEFLWIVRELSNYADCLEDLVGDEYMNATVRILYISNEYTDMCDYLNIAK
jgi:hypothetical protein